MKGGSSQNRLLVTLCPDRLGRLPLLGRPVRLGLFVTLCPDRLDRLAFPVLLGRLVRLGRPVRLDLSRLIPRPDRRLHGRRNQC
jgi:hypothetical protein